MIRPIGSSPPPVLPGPSSSTVLQADGAAVPGATRSVLPRFARRSGVLAPMAFKHKNHRNINSESAQRIQEMEKRLDQASRSQRPGTEVVALLHDLLDLPFFEHVPQIPPQAFSALFSELDKCPIMPDEEQLAEFSQSFIRGLAALQNTHTPGAPGIDNKELEKMARQYLQSNRWLTKAAFQTAVGERIQTATDVVDSPSRGSAQKMALETFETALTYGRLNMHDRMRAIEKLVDILPNLGHHEIAERNPQRRGLKLFEKIVDRLPPDEAAEMLAYLMKTVGNLSQKLSRRAANINGKADKTLEVASILSTGALPAIPFAVGAGIAGPYLAIPAAVAISGFGAGRYLSMKKQPQGSALYIVQDQLVKLRGRWDQVSPDKRKKLSDAFNTLRADYGRLAGTKKSTLKRFFNNKFIDPSRFPVDPSPSGELRRRLHHRLLAPVTTRTESIAGARLAGVDAMSIPGYADATEGQRALLDLLQKYHAEAGAAISHDFLTEFIKKTNGPGFENAAGIVRDAFSRVKEMTEYGSPAGRISLLDSIVEMTKRLCDGDREFVQSFVSAAQLAGENCHNNARQIFQALENAVIIDKARNGEDGLGGEGALLRLARGMFHHDKLKEATREVMAEVGLRVGLEVEAGNAVQIALGARFGIPNPIQGVGYVDTIKHIVTPENLRAIGARTEEKITDDDFVKYLTNWDPLTKKIKASPSFKEELERRTAEAREIYEAAENSYFDGAQTDEAFNTAAFAFQHAIKSEENALLEARIKDLVAADSAGALLDDDTPMAPSGLDEQAWNSFIKELDGLPPSNTPAETGTEDFQESMPLQFNALPLPSNAVIERDDMPAQVMPTEGGGDCLFHALDIPSDEIGQMRRNVADAIRKESGEIEYLGRNALNVLGALSQTPATQHIAVDLMAGREIVSSEAYARLVEMPGIYAGFDELRLLSTLPAYKDQTIVVIDNDGTISRYKNGDSTTESCTPDRKKAQLQQAIADADIALYKTPGHWEKIDLASAAG
ncbi:hypothetical protein EGT07_21690 [Herbaspirillum sp. HC18]|nr:hypothetical protein EGT07_21690 [Herbaspirillum sp. HC18]